MLLNKIKLKLNECANHFMTSSPTNCYCSIISGTSTKPVRIAPHPECDIGVVYSHNHWHEGRYFLIFNQIREVGHTGRHHGCAQVLDDTIQVPELTAGLSY